MPNYYEFRYFNATGGMIRMATKQCADDRAALIEAAEGAETCERAQILRGEHIVWEGPCEQLRLVPA